MEKKLWLLLIILIVNAVIAVVYVIASLLLAKKTSKVKCVFQGIIMLICPVIGCVYFFLSWLTLKFFFTKMLDYSDIGFDDSRVKTLVAPDYEREINVVPIEDALAVSDKYSLRKLLLDVLKYDREESIPAIVLSLSSEDSETSHYAASVLMDVISEFSKTIGVLQSKFNADPKEYAADGMKMILLILYYLEQKLFSEIQAKTYLAIADGAAEILYTNDPTSINETVMLSFVQSFLNNGNSDDAEKWAIRLSRHYPNTLERYNANLKVYYRKGQRDDFFALLEDLKKSNITVDHEILSMIRMFNAPESEAAQKPQLSSGKKA